MALVFVMGILPLTLGLIAFSEISWTYHALASLTRAGAQYAATHCYQDDAGSNVVNWMQANAPAFPDKAKLLTGGILIQVSYWRHDPDTRESVPFTCAGGCSPDCVPDSVTVSIVGYQFEHFLPMLGFQALQTPGFSSTMEIHGSGADPETGISLP